MAPQVSSVYPAALIEPGGDHRIPLSKVQIGPEEEEAVLGVLRSGRLAGGARVAELEEAFASAHDAAHAVAMSNGTTALVAALRAHRIGPGDEVITTPLTFVATLNAILECGAVARFADVADDLTVDPAKLAALVTPRTRALLPVHLYGLPAAMAAISQIAREHGLAIIEDAAQAHGARVDGAPVGSSGTAIFSFYGTKNITCGEGGIVTTSDDEIARRLRLLRNHGMWAPYEYVLPGYNYRLTDLQAVIVSAQLRRLADINASRARNAARLSEGLAGLPGLVLPAVSAGRTHVWHQYVVQVTADAAMDRDQLSRSLDSAGIDSRAYYPALVHDYSCYRDHPQVIIDKTPRASRAVREVLALPVHPALAPGDIDRIVACVRTALSADLPAEPERGPRQEPECRGRSDEMPATGDELVRSRYDRAR
jgi:perosamine synthetase